MHELRVEKGLSFHWKPRIFDTAFWDSRFSVLCASLTFTENTVLGIERMPRSLKIDFEAARLLEKEINTNWRFL